VRILQRFQALPCAEGQILAVWRQGTLLLTCNKSVRSRPSANATHALREMCTDLRVYNARVVAESRTLAEGAENAAVSARAGDRAGALVPTHLALCRS
jgi:hypothetical protein